MSQQEKKIFSLADNSTEPVETAVMGTLNIRLRFSGKESDLLYIIDVVKEHIIDMDYGAHNEQTTIELTLNAALDKDK